MIHDPKHWRDRFAAQDTDLVQAVLKIAGAVADLPADSRFSPVEPRALLVGGSVRDLIGGEAPKDIDLEVFGVPPEKLEQVVRELFKKVDVVGASFGILKVFLESGHEIDIGLPRTESKTGQGHRGFIVKSDPALSYREAARRRDFTINAIALDPLTGMIHDPFDGAGDLERKLLRMVDEQTFTEDPLRVYRGVQLAARLDFTLDGRTMSLMKNMVQHGALDELTPERVTDEWKKLLVKALNPSIGVKLMLALGIIDTYYPELAALINTPQEPEWHPEGTVWIHTNMVIDQAARISRQPERKFSVTDRLLVVLGALCHDFGKALTTRVIDGRIRSLGHEEAGEAPVRTFLGRLTFGQDVTDAVVKITKDHLKTTRYYKSFLKGEVTEEQYANSVRRLLRRIAPVSHEIFLAVTEADKRGRGFVHAETEPYPEGAMFQQTMDQYDLLIAAQTPLVTGGELVKAFALEPGPRIGVLLKAVEAARDEGELRTKAEALDFVKTLL